MVSRGRDGVDGGLAGWMLMSRDTFRRCREARGVGSSRWSSVLHQAGEPSSEWARGLASDVKADTLQPVEVA